MACHSSLAEHHFFSLCTLFDSYQYQKNSFGICVSRTLFVKIISCLLCALYNLELHRQFCGDFWFNSRIMCIQFPYNHRLYGYTNVLNNFRFYRFFKIASMVRLTSIVRGQNISKDLEILMVNSG